eukprot:6212261-Pleurochrysis_carterae.AAC.1
MFNVVPGATIMETMIYMGLRAVACEYIDALSPPSLGGVVTRWLHLYIIVHPNINIVPDR